MNEHAGVAVLKKVMVVLAILTVVMGTVTVCAEEWPPEPPSESPPEGKYGLFIAATELVEEPSSFYDATDPDPYTLEAIENPGKWVHVGEDEVYDQQPWAWGTEPVIKYEGKYYYIHHLFQWPPEPPSESPPEGKSGLFIAATELGYKPLGSYIYNVTDPDPYTLEAIENPSKWVHVSKSNEAFDQMYPNQLIEYQGKYYYIQYLFVDALDGDSPPAWLIGLLGACGTILVVLGIYIYRRKKVSLHRKGEFQN